MTILTLDNAPIPLSDAIARPHRAEFGNRPDPLEGMVTMPWIDYFTQLVSVVSANPVRRNTVELTAQGASIGATDMAGGLLNIGLYRVTIYARITRAATTSSSLTVTVAWTDGGVSVSSAVGPETGNTTATILVLRSQLIHVDTASPVTYATTYASVGATSMLYSLAAVLEEIKA